MHFDQFNAVKKGKIYFFTIHPISALPHKQTFKRKISISQKLFSNTLVYNCRSNTHLPNPTNGFTNGFSVAVHAKLIFEKLLASCLSWFI